MNYRSRSVVEVSDRGSSTTGQAYMYVIATYTDRDKRIEWKLGASLFEPTKYRETRPQPSVQCISVEDLERVVVHPAAVQHVRLL